MERHNGPRSGESRRTSAGGETYSERAADAIHDHVAVPGTRLGPVGSALRIEGLLGDQPQKHGEKRC